MGNEMDTIPTRSSKLSLNTLIQFRFHLVLLMFFLQRRNWVVTVQPLVHRLLSPNPCPSPARWRQHSCCQQLGDPGIKLQDTIVLSTDSCKERKLLNLASKHLIPYIWQNPNTRSRHVCWRTITQFHITCCQTPGLKHWELDSGKSSPSTKTDVITKKGPTTNLTWCTSSSSSSWLQLQALFFYMWGDSLSLSLSLNLSVKNMVAFLVFLEQKKYVSIPSKERVMNESVTWKSAVKPFVNYPSFFS